MSGGDHIYYGTVVDKLEGESEMTIGFVDLLHDERKRSKSHYFLHSRSGLYARCFAHGFRVYECLAYA